MIMVRLFKKMRDTSAGKDLDYQEIMLTAFVRKVLIDKPTAVIITGDLTFNGARRSGEKLTEIFAPLKKSELHFYQFRETMILMMAGRENLKENFNIGFRKSLRKIGKNYLQVAIKQLQIKIIVLYLIV